MGEVAVLVQYGRKKLEVKADLSWSIKDLKQALLDLLEEDVSSLPKMKILSKGKKRGDEEILSNCGIKPPKSKVMLLLSKPIDGSGVNSSKASTQQIPPPTKREKVKVELTTGGTPLIKLKVTGYANHDIVVQADSLNKTLGELKEVISSHFGWPVEQFRLLARGKTDPSTTLKECKVKPPTARMVILFKQAFFQQNEGSSFLENAEKSVGAVEESIEDIKQRIALRLVDRESLHLEILPCRKALLDVRGPLEENQVKAADSERASKLRERVRELLQNLEDLKM